MKWDAVVVGGGLGGLTTAAYLAANGQRVALVEQYDVLGGSTHVFRRRGRWEFDCGIHYIENAGPNGLMPFVLSGLGLNGRVDFLPMDPTGHNVIVAPDFELKVPHGWDNYLANLIEAFPAEESALRRYVALMRAAAKALDRLDPNPTMFGMLRRAGIAAPFFLMPYPAVLAMCGLSAKAIVVLVTEVCDYAATPSSVVFGMHAMFMDQFISGGAWFPRGGGQTLAANFAEIIVANGGTIRTGVSVDRIVIADRKVTGVRLSDGEVLVTDKVVSGADIRRTMLELVGPEHLPLPYRLRAQAWTMSWPFLNTYFGLELDLRDTPNANYFVIPSWEGTASLVHAGLHFPRLVSRAHRGNRDDWLSNYMANMPAFVQSSTVRDPGNAWSAPAGCAAVEAMTLTPVDPSVWGVAGHGLMDRSYRQEAVYRDLKERLTDAMLDRVERAYPGARANVQWSEAATPATQIRYTRTTGGTAFGLEPSITQFGPTRPGPRTPIAGLFLAGTSTVAGPGTTGALISGMHAAGAVLGRDLVAEVRAGAVFGNPADLPVHTDGWDPLRVSRRSAVESFDEDADPITVGR